MMSVDAVAYSATVAEVPTSASRPTCAAKAAFASMNSDNESDIASSSTKSRSSSRDGLSTDEGYTSCSEVTHSSDSEAGEEEVAASGFASPRNAAMYPITLMLQLRMLVGACASPLSYSTRPREDDLQGSRAAEQLIGQSTKRVPLPLQKTIKETPAKTAPLTASPTSWAAQLKQRRSAESASGDAEVSRAARSILNKLTVERFDGLYEQLAGCGIATPSHIAILVREIFGKATAQHSFIPMYADLCARLESDERLMASAMANSSGDTTNIFRRSLLNQCQNSFEQMLDITDIQGGDVSDEEEKELKRSKRKQCALGNVKLVGQLLTRGMLSSKLLLTCCHELISGHEQCPEALESLAALLTVAGPTFDVPRWDYHPALEAIFAQVRDMVNRGNSSELPSRVRYLLRDLLELRENQWADQKKATTQSKGPMKLEEVRECANAPEVNQNQAQKTSGASRGSKGGRGARDSRGGKAVAMASPSQPVPSQPLCSKPSPPPPCHGLARAAVSLMQTTSKKDTETAEKEKNKEMEARAMQRLTSLVNIASVEATPAGFQHGPGGSSSSSRGSGTGRSIAPSDAPWFNNTTSLPKGQPLGQSLNHRRTMKPEAPPRVVRPPAAVAKPEHNVTAGAGSNFAPASLPEAPFERSVFRRELSAVLRELSVSHDVAAAVRRIRQQRVPVTNQAVEFADLLTRAAEESRGPARRSAFAFSAGLANGDFSAFDRAKCAEGISAFFREVYEDLCEEVPRLPAIVTAELLPTLRAAIPTSQLSAVVPAELMK